MEKINITDIIVIGVLVLVGGYFIKSWISDMKDAKDKDDSLKLAHDTNLTSKGIETVAATIPKKDRPSVQANLKAFDPKPIADMIHDASGVFDDDEDKVYTAFSMLQNKAELALLSLYFQKLYKTPVISYIQSFLNFNELAQIKGIIDGLKPY